MKKSQIDKAIEALEAKKQVLDLAIQELRTALATAKLRQVRRKKVVEKVSA